ncbi:hypothetical protein [Myxosarcina sp. GI1]|uniref:hypothetical protein n=1 Tax=Myxosarcina sp. GI1 TaxID=1541065 RepID=UPI00055C5CC1|nr:hypothetical protein [Myxosarcina sp. GI1]
MWNDRGRQIAIAINLEQVKLIQYLDGTQDTSSNAIKPINRGIFVNPTLDKKKYLSLLKVFHPDVSNLDTKVATQIAQTIISTKDGTVRVTNLWKTNYTARSNQSQQSESKAKTSSDFDQRSAASPGGNRQGTADSWWRKYGSVNQRQKNASGSGNNSESKSTAKERNFETWLGYVPKSYWNKFGSKDTFSRDYSVEFRIFKRCYYAYFDTELEIVFRSQWLVRERIVAIHRHIFRIIHQVDLSKLNKNDLWCICELERISYKKTARKTDLVDDVLFHLVGLFVERAEATDKDNWTLSLRQNQTLWKHKFIYPDYYGNFEQFSSANRQARTNTESSSRSSTSDYLNCGQYLKLRNRWLERDQFLYFLNLTRKTAQQLQVQTFSSDGYPSYPLEILELAWEKMSL